MKSTKKLLRLIFLAFGIMFTIEYFWPIPETLEGFLLAMASLGFSLWLSGILEDE